MGLVWQPRGTAAGFFRNALLQWAWRYYIPTRGAFRGVRGIQYRPDAGAGIPPSTWSR